MPRDLFGDVAVRPPSVRSRRSPVVVASITVHVLVVVAVLLMTAIAPDILPAPREALAFYEPARLIDIALPPPPPAPRSAAAPPQIPTVSQVRGTGRRTDVDCSGNVDSDLRGVEPRRRRRRESGQLRDQHRSRVRRSARARCHRTTIAAATRGRRDQSAGQGRQRPANLSELAQRTRVEDVVILETVIDESGNVTSARVLRGHPLLNQAALEAVQRWKFTPARLNDEAIPVVMTVTVQFKLQ
jgi:TonB family protein